MENTKAVLYIIPTPIGNLEDITFRAVNTLLKVSLIAVEDTRTSLKLLKHYNIDTPTISYHKFNERQRTDRILKILLNGEDVAVISDAGTPGISDPSSIIISEAIAVGIRVETLPGATAFVPALISSGLDSSRFFFVGFLPEKEKMKKKILSEISNYSYTLIFYEGPHRIGKTIQLLLKYFGNRKVVIAREISKIYETYIRTNLKNLVENPDLITIKGEFVIIVEGKKELEITDDDIKKIIRKNKQSGLTLKEVVKTVVKQTGAKKNRVYQLALNINDNISENI